MANRPQKVASYRGFYKPIHGACAMHFYLGVYIKVSSVFFFVFSVFDSRVEGATLGIVLFVGMSRPQNKSLLSRWFGVEGMIFTQKNVSIDLGE